jgi:hypothetical protein
MKQEATSGVYKVLGDQARRHPDRIVNDPFKLSAKLETGHFAYPFVIFIQFHPYFLAKHTTSFMNYLDSKLQMNTFTVFFVSAQYKKEGKCRFKVSKPLPVTTGYYSLLFKKGTSYTKTISRGLVILEHSRLILLVILTLTHLQPYGLV